MSTASPELSFKPIPTISEQAKTLAAYIQDLDQATYEELENVAGETVRIGRGRGWLETAKRVLQRERRQVWVTVRGTGIKRADTGEVIDAARNEVTKAHHAARRGIKRISTLDFDKLENPERIRLNTVASHLGALHGITTHKAAEKLTAAVSVQQAKLPLGKTLAAFGAANGDS